MNGILALLLFVAQDDPQAALTRTLQKLRADVSKAVVAVEVVRDKDPEGTGGSGAAGTHKDYYNRPAGPASGTILSPDGYILTSAFNVSGGIKRITVTTHDGKEYEAKGLGYNMELDIALLKIEAKDLPVLVHAKADEFKQGDLVGIVGRSPDKATPTINHGILSATGRFKNTAVQTDAELNYGNVGGPLVTLRGELIGITCHIKPRTHWGQSSGVGFATKLAEIQKVLEDLKKNKRTEKTKDPWIGIMAGKAREGVEGVPVDQVVANSPAEEAGLEQEDVITAVDGAKVKSIEELKAALAKREIGQEVELTYKRQKKAGEWEEKKVKIKLAENPN